MLRLAKNTDLVKLVMKHAAASREIFSDHIWGLKAMGYLYLYDYLIDFVNNTPKTNKLKLLEIGAGHNISFYKLVSKDILDQIEYWTADKEGFYDDAKLASAKSIRKNTKHINTLLGDFNHDLPTDYFDLVFSVSVVEHIPESHIANVFADVRRILKNMGRFFNSIDLQLNKLKFIESVEAAHHKNSFEYICPEEIGIDPNVTGTLYEPLAIVYNYYTKHTDLKTKILATEHNVATTLYLSRKI